ncbi:MAG: hypothetical protein K0Q89_491 [Thermomicrobiales bacterium]|nr:hypothetical protein [Thermomicrobiales bacterium]
MDGILDRWALGSRSVAISVCSSAPAPQARRCRPGARRGANMDGASFDRLSRTVHRLRHHTTRREALRIVAVGGLAGLLTRLEADDVAARCKRLGRRCKRSRECCKRLRCRRRRCRPRRDGGGGGDGCGGTTCRNDWSCCTISGTSRCIDRDYLICCGSSICERGGDCCGAGCCSKGWKCCGDGRCCPDGWTCGNTACFDSQNFDSQNADVSAESAESTPFAEPVKSDEQRWIERGWMTAPKTE